MPTLLRRLSLVLLAALLSACAGLQPATTSKDWEQHRQQLDALVHWTASGKLALRSPTQAESASMLWQQVGEATHLRLSGPLGVSATTIDSDGREIRISRGGEQERLDLSDPDALYLRTGWQLPLTALPYWLKGVPAPQPRVRALQLQADGQLLQQFEQSGWTISYQAYANFGDLLLPTKVRLQRGDHSARLVLREWRNLAP